MISALRPINTVARQSVFVVQRRTVISLAKTVVSQYLFDSTSLFYDLSLYLPILPKLIGLIRQDNKTCARLAQFLQATLLYHILPISRVIWVINPSLAHPNYVSGPKMEGALQGVD
ncbi:hypothetical protein RSOLAG1IB_01541 [Rhizoctonia solani AG-1 IB]|uniref:Uncharacterized protein n=1 Tax=Thanatephorus cucumeris (strain AG1-IB / isolate 7/3/14) TaxID=1108050 RepID=A0A0B7FF59_THACB|nr:hypothetical protein RSOLAG1IB_01541 [Rhizoctonia solani AG-1 IB]